MEESTKEVFGEQTPYKSIEIIGLILFQQTSIFYIH
jgi:hypothetical protein